MNARIVVKVLQISVIDKLCLYIDSFNMQFQRPAMIQSQKFAMNPQLYQAIKMMELPIIDVRQKIEEELERNPALEVLEDNSTLSIDAVTDAAGEAGAGEPEFEYFEAGADSGFSDLGYVTSAGEQAAEEQRRFIEGALSHPETLQDHLLWQLQLEPVDGELRQVCQQLIQNLDDDGFHREPVEVLLESEDPRTVSDALALVRQLDPAGTCTADYRESLLVQVGLLPDTPAGVEKALSHLDLLERGKIAEAARRIGLSEKETAVAFETIKLLSPFPGRRFNAAEVRYVIPDAQVIKKDGEFVIILNEEEIPVLGINPFFMKIADDFAGSHVDGKHKLNKEEKPVRNFVRENIKEARWFINSINQRNHTLLKVCRALVEFQRGFFENGPKHLAPLTLGDIAKEIALHETTVSRAANGKYIQTEWGIFELRHFFSNSISGTGSGGSKFSKEGVKEVIREIITSDHARLSDQDIVELLAKRGIALARRTVAKYRNELDLRSSFDR